MKTIQIQTTSHCNGKCVICPYPDSWFVKNPGRMSNELYTKILDDLNDYDPTFSGHFCPYLCNEPFADRNIVERAKQAINTLHNPYLEISTNLTLASNAAIDKLLKVYEMNGWNGRMMISHHGWNKMSYETTMGLSYGKALNKLKYLIKKANGNLSIWLHTAVESRDTSILMSSEEHIKRYWMQFVIENKLPKKNLQIWPLYFHNRAGNVKMDSWRYDKIVREIGPAHPFDCYRIHDCLHVIYTGEIILCCCDYQHETVIGDLSKQTIKEFYASDKWKEYYKMVRGDIESPDDFICKRCQFPGA